MPNEQKSKTEARLEEFDKRLTEVSEDLRKWKYRAQGFLTVSGILAVLVLAILTYGRIQIDQLQHDVLDLQKQAATLKTDVGTLQATANDMRKFLDSERESQQRIFDEYALSKRNEFNDNAKTMQATYEGQLDDFTLIKQKQIDTQVVTATLGIQTQMQQISSRVTQVEGNLTTLSRDAMRSGNHIQLRSLRFDTCIDSAEQAPNLIQLIDCKDVSNQTWILLRK